MKERSELFYVGYLLVLLAIAALWVNAEEYL